MMAEDSGPFDDGAMGEQGWNFIHTAHNGVLDNIMNRLAAAVSSSTARGVEVSSGVALHGGFFYSTDDTVTVVAPDNTSGSPRVDRLVARVDRSANEVFLHVVEGTPASNPSPPSITGSDEPLHRWRLESGSGSVSDLRSERAFISGFVTHGARPVTPNDGHIHLDDDGRTLQFDGSQWQVLAEDTGWVAVSLQNHWAQSSNPLQIRRDGKTVTLSGRINRGDTFPFRENGFQQIASLSSQFRPARNANNLVVVFRSDIRSMWCQVLIGGSVSLLINGTDLPAGDPVFFNMMWLVD